MCANLLQVANLLIETGANIAAETETGVLPLHYLIRTDFGTMETVCGG